MQLRQLIISLFSMLLRGVPVPPSFRIFNPLNDSPVIVTPGESIIIEALLKSFCKRSGIKNLCKIGSSKAEDSVIESLRWVNFKDDAAISKLLVTAPHTRFSTLNIFFGNGPMRSSPRYELSLLEQLSIFFVFPFLIIVFGDPITIIAPTSNRDNKISRQFKLDFYRNLKMVRGTPFQTLEAQMRVVLGGKEFDNECRIIADRMGTTPERIAAEAKRSFIKMAAVPRRSIFLLISFIANLLLKRIFSTIRIRNIEPFLASSKLHPTVLVPTHRSHLDYIILSWVLFQSKLNPPLVAAGENLSFFPAGFFLRSVGAYFIKRSVRGDRINSVVLRRYVSYLLKRGHLQEFFIEGTRSRSGKMLPPRLGILRILVDAYHKGFRSEILFVPVSITYENVVEDSVYGQENTGKKKQKESLLGLFRARGLLSSKFGDVHVTFGDPIKVSDYFGSASTKSFDASEPKNTLVNFGYEITDRIRSQSDTSLTSLVYTALLMAPKYSMPRELLNSTIKKLASVVDISKGIDCKIGDLTPSLKSFLDGNDSLLDDLIRGGIIRQEIFLGSSMLTIPGNKRFTADFYRNASIHHFISIATLALLELLNGEIDTKKISNVYEIMRYPFLLPKEDVWIKKLQITIETLLDKNWLIAKDGKLKFAKREQGIFMPGLLLATLQSELWVIHLLRWHRSKSNNEDQLTISYNDFMKDLQDQFKLGMNLGLVSRTEAASKANIITALESLASLDRISIADGQDKIVIKSLPAEHFKFLMDLNNAIQHFMDESLHKLRGEFFPPEDEKKLNEGIYTNETNIN